MPGRCRAPCGWATCLFTSAHSQFLCSDTNFLRLHPGCGPHTVFRWQVKLRYESCLLTHTRVGEVRVQSWSRNQSHLEVLYRECSFPHLEVSLTPCYTGALSLVCLGCVLSCRGGNPSVSLPAVCPRLF